MGRAIDLDGVPATPPMTEAPAYDPNDPVMKAAFEAGAKAAREELEHSFPGQAPWSGAVSPNTMFMTTDPVSGLLQHAPPGAMDWGMYTTSTGPMGQHVTPVPAAELAQAPPAPDGAPQNGLDPSTFIGMGAEAPVAPAAYHDGVHVADAFKVPDGPVRIKIEASCAGVRAVLKEMAKKIDRVFVGGDHEEDHDL